MSKKYVEPSFKSDAFNCPHCGAYAHQEWFSSIIEDRTNSKR